MLKKKLAAVVSFALLSPSIHAADEPGFYVGIGAGQVTLKDNVLGVEVKGTDMGLKGFAGYRFNEYGSLEATYLDAGTPDDTISGVTIESDARAIQVSALWQIPIRDRFEAYFRISGLSWRAESTAAVNGRTIGRLKNDGTDWGLGLGAAFHVTQNFGLRAEFEGAEFDGTDFRAISIASLMKF